jgi:hypothetical protein
MDKISNIAGGRIFPYNVWELLKPANWLFEFKQDRQRKKRGWSDRDTWNGGEYILSVVSGVLKKLGDEKSHIDWDEYFKTNYPNNQGYNSLIEVAEDIDAYLEFDELDWSRDLDFEIIYDKKPAEDGCTEIVDINTPEENRQIKKAIEASRKEYDRRYKKAKKAMTFVAVNFPGLWD